jgi:hypothetical protein
VLLWSRQHNARASQDEKGTGGIVTGIVALGTSLVILFLYPDFYWLRFDRATPFDLI